MTVKLKGPHADHDPTASGGLVRGCGNYRVTPMKLGYLFNPVYRGFSNLIANQTSNFTAAARAYTITAHASRNGLAMAGVTMKLTGARTLSCTTSSNGTCQFTRLPAGGSYTVTPSSSGFTFTSRSRTYGYLTTNVTASFTAAPVTGIQGGGTRQQ